MLLRKDLKMFENDRRKEAHEAKLAIIEWQLARRLRFQSVEEADKDSCIFFADMDENTIVS